MDDNIVKNSICKNGPYLYNIQYIAKKFDYIAYVKHEIYCSLAVSLHNSTHLHTHALPWLHVIVVFNVFVLLA